MTPEQYRSEQNRLNRLIAARAVVLARDVKVDNDVQWRRLVTALYALVRSDRLASNQLALAYYSSLSPTGNAPPVPAPEYTPEMTREALDRFRERGLNATRSERRQFAATAAAAMVRHSEQAGRETVLRATREDGVRWARVDPRPPCCPWCLLMIARGPVYLSDSVRSGGFLAHDYDTCLPEPVFPRKDWHGRRQYEAAEAFYTEHAAGNGGQLRALRQAVAENGSPI